MSTDTAPRDKTFRNYTQSQSANYAQHRRNYHPSLYKALLDEHVSTGGKLTALLDVGCGPGTAVRSLAPHFEHATGLDPSAGMLDTARSLGGKTSTGDDIVFKVSQAEELGGMKKESVDLITAASAAHWFDMPHFWERAAQVLRPGGSVAMWTSGNMCADASMPGAEGVNAAIARFEERVKDYMEAGNWLTRGLYRDLPLPWTVGVNGFDEDALFRKEWGTNATSASGSEFMEGDRPVNLDVLEMVVGTVSPVVRWREGNGDCVGTERDVVRMMRREIERAMRDAGVEKGKEILKGGVAGVLLIVKKSS